MNYIIFGKVIKGDGYGKKIGYPTINLSRPNDTEVDTEALPPYGVYAGQVLLNRKKYKAGIVIGPLDKKGLPKIEAYLIGYKGNAYGQDVVIEIKGFIRKFRKFKTQKELIKQIKKDLQTCSRA